MSPGLTAVLWLLLPISAPIAAWYIYARRAKADPNANIEAGVTELSRFRQALASTNPTDASPADHSEAQRD